MSTFKNFVQCRVTTPFTAAADSIGLYAAVPPYSLPSEEGGLLVLTDSPTKPSKLEVISYTSRSALGLYGVTRGLEGTIAQSWTGPVYCYQSLLAGEFKTLLDSKVDKVTGKQLSDENYTQVEKTKLGDIALEATKNRADSENADKLHPHTMAQVTGLDTALTGKADKTTQVMAGTGLTGGGTLAANRTLAVTYGTAAGTAAQGNDTRINNGQTAFGWGNHASAGYAKTKADVGLSGIPDTNASTANFLRGDGTWVTPPNTTYTEITTAEIDAGTASTLRTISGRRMKYALDKKVDTVHEHSISDVTGLQVEIDSKANTSTQVIAGTGLTGGGDLTANRTLNVSYGTTAGTSVQGNDSRVVNALQKANILQTTGTSTDLLMSQKATTDSMYNIPSVPKSSAYTATALDKGKSIDTTAGVTLPASVFAVGDVIVVTNTSSSDISITPASGVTFRLAGSDSTGLRTLAGYGVATLRMVTSNVWFASGAGLS